MAKKRVRKADKKKAKEKKQGTERAVNDRFNEMMKEKGYNIAADAQLTEEQRQLLIDFPGKKPRPHKVKTKYSGRVPPIPPPQLLDLIHNFLKDFKYIKAAHGVRTDNQKRPGHNMDIWKWTSEGLPDLLEMFNQWWREHPNVRPIVNPDDPVGYRRRTKDGEILAGAPTILGEAPKGSQSSDKNEDSRPMSLPGSEIDSDEDHDVGMDMDANFRKIDTKPTVGSKRKASELTTSSSSSSMSDTSDDGSKLSSQSNSSSEPDSKSEASAKHASAAKKIKLESGLALSSVSAKDKKLGRDASPDTASEVSSSFVSSSSSSISSSGSGHEKRGKEAPSSKPKAQISGSDSDGSSSSEARLDEADNPGVREEGTLHKPQKHGETNGVRASHSSDTSATIPAQINDIQKRTEEKEITSSSDSDSSSSSESGSDSESDSGKDAGNKVNDNPKGHAKVTSTVMAGHRGDKSEGIASSKTTPKSHNVPFSRIPSNIKVEDRFSSNAYRAYDYAERAHQDLIKTKGKGFTKEKNKKKKGSYRGGVIDISGGKGIKFDD